MQACGTFNIQGIKHKYIQPRKQVAKETSVKVLQQDDAKKKGTTASYESPMLEE